VNFIKIVALITVAIVLVITITVLLPDVESPRGGFSAVDHGATDERIGTKAINPAVSKEQHLQPRRMDVNLAGSFHGPSSESEHEQEARMGGPGYRTAKALPKAIVAKPGTTAETSVNQQTGLDDSTPIGREGIAVVTPTSGSVAQYVIPSGERAPVVFLPEDRTLTPPMQAFLDNVREEFDATIAAADDPAEVWNQARQLADDRYRLLLGDDAYNRKTMQDAIEALKASGNLPSEQPPTVKTPSAVGNP